MVGFILNDYIENTLNSFFMSHFFIIYDIGSTHLLFFNFRSVPLQFDSIEQERNENGTEMELDWKFQSGTGMEQEWNGNGTGMELEWSGNGTEREWNGSGTKIQWADNECSVQGAWPVIRLYTSWEPLIELPLSVL